MHASYNITTDKLHFRPDERLSPEAYDACKKAGFSYWPGSKQFVCKWSPQAEDFVLSQGAEIAEDFTPDDVESRVERFAKYADKAEQQADNSEAYLLEKANTERRRQNALNSIEKNTEIAAHWQSRIAGAIRHAEYKDKPAVILRRIKGLEADQRKFAKRVDIRKTDLVNPYDFLIKDEQGQYRRNENGKVIVDMERMKAAFEPKKAWAQRWLDHINARLAYERAVYEATGGIEADKQVIEVGGGVVSDWSRNGSPLMVTKVNKATVEIFRYFDDYAKFIKVPLTKITKIVSRAEYQASYPTMNERLEAGLKEAEERAARYHSRV